MPRHVKWMDLIFTTVLMGAVGVLGVGLLLNNNGDRTKFFTWRVSPAALRFNAYSWALATGLAWLRLVHACAIITVEELDNKNLVNHITKVKMQNVLSGAEGWAALFVIGLIVVGEFCFSTLPLIQRDSKSGITSIVTVLSTTTGVTYSLDKAMATAAGTMSAMATNVGENKPLSTVDHCVLASVNGTDCVGIIGIGQVSGDANGFVSGAVFLPSRVKETCQATYVKLHRVPGVKASYVCETERDTEEECDPSEFFGLDRSDLKDGIVVMQSNTSVANLMHRVCVSYPLNNIKVTCNVTFAVGTADVTMHNNTHTCRTINATNYTPYGPWTLASRMNKSLSELNFVLINAYNHLVKPLKMFDMNTVMQYIGSVYASGCATRGVNNEEDASRGQVISVTLIHMADFPGYPPTYLNPWLYTSFIVAGLAFGFSIASVLFYNDFWPVPANPPNPNPDMRSNLSHSFELSKPCM